jgi:hypothetical protein
MISPEDPNVKEFTVDYDEERRDVEEIRQAPIALNQKPWDEMVPPQDPDPREFTLEYMDDERKVVKVTRNPIRVGYYYGDDAEHKYFQRLLQQTQPPELIPQYTVPWNEMIPTEDPNVRVYRLDGEPFEKEVKKETRQVPEDIRLNGKDVEQAAEEVYQHPIVAVDQTTQVPEENGKKKE